MYEWTDKPSSLPEDAYCEPGGVGYAKSNSSGNDLGLNNGTSPGEKSEGVEPLKSEALVRGSKPKPICCVVYLGSDLERESLGILA